MHIWIQCERYRGSPLFCDGTSTMYGTIYFLDGRVAACWPNGERITSFHHLRLICIDSLTHDAEKKGWCFYHNWFKIEWKIDFSKYHRLIIYILEISGMLRHLNTSELLDKIWAALANISWYYTNHYTSPNSF